MSTAPTYSSFEDIKRRKPVRWWHEAIINDLIARPLDTLKERAERLGYTVPSLSVIINSDMFKVMHAARRRAVAERLDNSISEKLGEVAIEGLDLMLEQMRVKRTALPFIALNEVTNTALQRLGYGAQSSGASVHINAPGAQVAVLPAVSKESLASAREALRQVESQRAASPPKQIASQSSICATEIRVQEARREAQALNGEILPAPDSKQVE